ncbi:MAG: hypothetical protein WC107_00885 [Patescibacteria group bacterium]
MVARKKNKKKKTGVDLLNEISDKLITWVGTTNSIIIHTIIFIFSFISHWIFNISFDLVLLILTTVVSLEAIYLAIFIQRSVNQQATRLTDVEETLDDVEEALDDVEESLDEVEESIDDVEESISQKETSANSNTEKRLEEIIKELKALQTNMKK